MKTTPRRALIIGGLGLALVAAAATWFLLSQPGRFEDLALSAGPDALGEGEHKLAQAQAMVALATGRGEARDWLESNRYAHGWGLPFSWDAFQDGSVNPPDTSYAVTTAWALLAVPDPELARWWLDHAWTAGCYWYSDRDVDAACVPNVSALMLGASAPLVGDDPRIRATVDRLVQLARPGPVWPYLEGRARTNDLMHHAYIVWGLELYRDSGGELPWSREQLLASMATAEPSERWFVAGLAMQAAVLGRWGSGGEVPADAVSDPRTAAHIVLALSTN